MKRLIIITATVLAALACTKEQSSTDPCTFEISIPKVKGTKAWFSIKPSNPNAYYAYGVFNELAEDIYDLPVMDLAKINLDWWIDAYKMWEESQENIGTFADVYCYQGEREIKQTGLGMGLEHRLFVVQLDPQTRTIIGTPQDVRFTTKSVEMLPLKFDIEFGADYITITPSDPSATYYWDYDNAEQIERTYFTPQIFYYSVVDLYEDYDFMPNMISKGTETYVFSQNDKSLEEGERCTLVLAGYANGEINSDSTVYEFVYHKDKPIEFTLYSDDEE